MKIWIYADGRQQGPFTPGELAEMKIRPETPVWYEGAESWKPAFRCQELAFLFDGDNTVSETVEESPRTEPVKAAGAVALPEPPPTYLGWTIFLTLCCCSPLSLAGLVSSICTSMFYNSGKYEKSRKASDVTVWLVMISIALGFIPLILMLNWIF